ncbi:MAG: ABC transporter ATP-binding protein [Proteobacteria bacterium]|nr:ABC transporter ATP-binding protein [Pseudomonadota bacterium]
MLEIKDLWVYYGHALALENVNITVADKGLTAVIGPNGAGKTTLLKAISRLINPQKGSISFNGQSLLKYPPHKLAQMGIAHCPEGRKPFPEMTVLENLLVGAYVLPRNQIQGRLEMVFDLFPILKERRDQISITLSGGEQQMLAIGRAWMISPSLLLIDEPSLGLSPLIVDEVERIIGGIKESGVSVLMVEGNVDLIRDLPDIVYVLDHGSLIYSGTVSQILGDTNLSKTYFGM